MTAINSGFDVESAISKAVSFISTTVQTAQKQTLVIAVSGGIDSATSVTLATRAIGAENIQVVLLPYQTAEASEFQTSICDFNNIPQENRQVIAIKPMVDVFETALNVSADETLHKIRRANLQARARMMCVYDQAKKHQALVCGTENKSEHWLGYYTRFGDEASDLEPLRGWWKTQVYQVARALEIPEALQQQAPSAGLWPDQTDESELGFSYAQADRVMSALIDENISPEAISFEDIDAATVQKVLHRVQTTSFKHQVPYMMSE